MTSKVVSSISDFQEVLDGYLKLQNPPAFVAMAHSPQGRVAKDPREIKLDAINTSKQHQSLHFANTIVYQLVGNPDDGYHYDILTSNAKEDFPVIRPDRGQVDENGGKLSATKAAERAAYIARRRQARLVVDRFKDYTFHVFAKANDFEPAALEKIESEFTEMLNEVAEIMQS